MSLIGNSVIHRKHGDKGVVKSIEVKYLSDKFKILLTIEFEIDYDILTYKTDFNEIMVI